MSTPEAPAADTPADQAATGLEHGAYEVIRNRLAASGRELRARLAKLNEARKAVFGAIEPTLLATERVATSHNCIPRDLVPVGNGFLFGYNVHIGLKSTTAPEDVFAAYELRDHTFRDQPLAAVLGDDRFRRDFAELYKYYKKTQFETFWQSGPHVHLVFRIGDDPRDIKSFKWLSSGGRLQYVDNRSDAEVQFPPSHEFEWVRTRREMHTAGAYPHVNIEDRLFVETTGGDLTVKVEDNTDSGAGVYSEPVDDPDQRLDDAEIFYAIVENLVLLKIRPFQEERFRYLVFCEKTQTVRRLDTIEQACVLLPEDQGIIFANGYMLQTGEQHTFDLPAAGMTFRERIASANGEDYLFVFYNRQNGLYVLLPYNIIDRQVDTPVLCNGYALFASGQMVYFKAHSEPQKHHTLQIWQTPLTSLEHQPAAPNDGYLAKVGNRDIVRGLAECREVLGLIGRDDNYEGLFVDLVKKTGDILDAYYWLDHAETGNLREVLVEIKQAAEAAVSEFDKVQTVRRTTREQLDRATEQTRQLVTTVQNRRYEAIGDYVTSLAELRAARGQVVALRELRYVDAAQVNALEGEIRQQADRLAGDTVQFLLRPEALHPYEKAIAEQRAAVVRIEKGVDARQLSESVERSAGELAMLIEIVSNLKIDDATERMAIIDRISAVFAQLNQVRAQLKNRADEVLRREGAAEFASQLKLISQSIVNFLDVSDTPQKCDEHLTRMMVQVEELEGRFAEFDEFVVQLAEKRDEIYNAFETRKLQLVEARNRRATALMAAADRILKGIKARVEKMDSVAEIEGYYAADLMIEKVRDIVRQLTELGDSVKVDDIQGRLKTTREDAVRQLKDRQDLYEDGANLIRFGRHRFSVNHQAFELTTVLRDGQLAFHLTGTNYFDPIADPELLATRDAWNLEIVSESPEVYRSEYLAYQMLRALGTDGQPSAEELLQWTDAQVSEHVQRFAAPRYSEGYVKGVHDQDAARLLRALVALHAGADLLRFHPRARALAMVFWRQWADAERRQLLAAWLAGFGAVRAVFPDSDAQRRYQAELESRIAEFVAASGAFDAALIPQAAEYLFEELVLGTPVASAPARDLCDKLHLHLDHAGAATRYRDAVAAVAHDPLAAFLMHRAWLDAFLAAHGDEEAADYADEAAALLLTEALPRARVIDAAVAQEIAGMQGNHPVLRDRNDAGSVVNVDDAASVVSAAVSGGIYRLNYHEFLLKLARHEAEIVPKFTAYHRVKQQLVERERERLRLDEFRPHVLTSFVRNKLLDQVYLPLIGDNLAKQLGVAGEQKRTDRMGLLLLVSPPGYGKTTLMEYIANRLGIVFMKVNGPAIGHRVTSLDPAEAPNIAAREELEKLNLAFEMGDNVMIYLDDIQHCNAELLQKFIPLCDAQRKIEGVYRGKGRTYDLRGKKVAVVMAGNPYTESGERFKLPDMLANRADTYNLGEIIGGNVEAFELSYLENALTSNPVLAKLAGRGPNDVYAIVQMAGGGNAGVELEGRYSLAEVNEMVEVMRKLMRVRDVVLRVNQEYIRSAATAEDYRTEPPFKLQGSYRNMNRIAERVVAIMTPAELDGLILDNYQNDAQTLTTGAESNMLKFKDMLGILTPAETERWHAIQRTYRRNVQLRGVGEDEKVGQVIVQLSSFADGLDAIRQTLSAGLAQLTDRQTPKTDGPAQVQATLDAGTLAAVGKMLEALRPEPTPPTEVQIVSRVPAAVLETLRAQFQVMQGWIEPLHRQTVDQQQQFVELKQAIESCLANTRKLVAELEESARTGGSLEETLARHQVLTKRAPRRPKKEG